MGKIDGIKSFPDTKLCGGIRRKFKNKRSKNDKEIKYFFNLFMTIEELDSVVTKYINNKEVVEVEYIREKDGLRTCREMEPFDMNIWKKGKLQKLMFWGFCLFPEHNRMEQKIPENIISIKGTGRHFDPKTREASFTSLPNYRIPRNW
ncbi:MAG: hypothetical protein HY764_03195 [Candidatus Portnoybacteria bacterium]|nr:hypothetical protein [Candidatus Portnoybacteria bacterium]